MSTPNLSIATEHLMSLHVPGGGPPHLIDSSLAVYRQGAEGWARGPRITGTILPPTGDWMRIMPSGSFRVDARMMIRCDDGALIYVSYGGVISVSRENFERMSSGGLLTAQDMYFITTPVFQTAHPDYAWLNHLQALGRMAELKGGPDGHLRYEVFAVR
jgi:uncharacterized protein DUF3237